MGFLTRLDRLLVKVEEVLLALLLVSLIVLAATQVLLRNVWNTSIDWADVTLQNATVLIALLGAAIATSEGRHLNIDLVGRALRGRKRLALNIVIGIFGVITCALLTRGGWQTYRANFEPWLTNVPAGWSTMRMLQQEIAEGSFPQWLSQLMLPFGFGLIGVHFFLRLARDLSGLLGADELDRGDGGGEGDSYLDHIVAGAEEHEARVVDEHVVDEHVVDEHVAPEHAAGEPSAPQPRPISEEVSITQDADEEKTTAAIGPAPQRAPLGNAARATPPKGRDTVRISAELDDSTVSDALSDTLTPEREERTSVDEGDTVGDSVADEGETLFDPNLQDELARERVDGELAEAPTELARVRTDSVAVADAATELALPREDDEEKPR